MEPLFHIDDEVGLEAPPVGELGPGEALGAPRPAPAQVAPAARAIELGAEAAVAGLKLCCPNCGCQDCGGGGGQDPAVQMADQASVVTCPMCQCQFEAPQQAGEEMAMPVESSVQRILGRVFERHVRRHAHALQREAGRTKQSKLPGNAS